MTRILRQLPRYGPAWSGYASFSRHGALLEHLEQGRDNAPKTRNTRLSALRAFFRFVAYAEPACSVQCQRVLATPTKRHERRPVEVLTDDETAALLAAPDPTTWIGRRDRALLTVAVGVGEGRGEGVGAAEEDLVWGGAAERAG
ncbi:MAG: site-specific integrase [Polyangiaceae bacterium]|nr:site-specific integrase [Polyangiaceae bacterium]